ncbi:MAG: porin [Phycisphaerales bacterium]
MKSAKFAACSAAVVSFSSLTAFAGSEGSLLDLAEAIRADSMTHASLAPLPESLKASVQIQFRYNYNQRGSESTTFAGMPDNDVTVGFTNRRTKLGLEGKVTDDISAKIKFAFSQSSGAAAIEDAVMKWKLDDSWTFRAGQFKPSLLREENMSSSKQLATDRSSVNERFNQDFTQGIELIYTQDDWRFIGSFNDGFGADNTYFTSGTEADLAFTVRGEMRLGEASWGQYKQFTSWRGSNSGLMLGAGYHHQWMGETNPSTTPATEMGTGTIDASYVADGWNLYGAAVWRTTDTGTMTITDAGYLLQGGVFVSDQNEFFGRWDLITPSDSNPVVVGVSGAEDFNVFTVGWNHYLIPESHAAKFTLEAQVYPDPTTESIVRISGNILPDSTGDQFAITAQFQLLF